MATVLVCLVTFALACTTPASNPVATEVEDPDDAIERNDLDPSVTFVETTAEWTWTPPDPPGHSYVGDLEILAPSTGPNSQTVDITVKTWLAGNVEQASVTIRTPTELIGSLQLRPTQPEQGCADRADGTWTDHKIRQTTGCMMTNNTGITFLTWNESGSSYHFETPTLTTEQSTNYLAGWQPIAAG